MSTGQEKSTQVAKKKTDITEDVMKKVNYFQKSGEMRLPDGYSAENAIKGAQLILAEMSVGGKSVYEKCTRVSVANSLFRMVTLGLSVVKKQGSFIAYGSELKFQEEYTGNIVLAKRYGGLAKNPKAHVIYKGDEFDFEIDTETGLKKIIKHKTSIENFGIRSKIIGAYCIYETTDGQKDVEIMNMEQIENAWKQGAMKGNSGAHNNFTDQMCIKTVINRACKLLFRGSDDSVLYDNEDENLDYTKANVDQEIRDNANEEFIDIDSEEVVEDAVEEKQEEEKPKEASATEEKKEEKPSKLF